MSVIMDGKKIKEDVLETLKEEIKISPKNIRLVTLGFTEKPSSLFKRREKIADVLGLEFDYSCVTINNVFKVIDDLNNSHKVTGIIIEEEVLGDLTQMDLIMKINPGKDVEGKHPLNYGKLSLNQKAYTSPIALAVLELLKAYDIEVTGKHVVVFGRGTVVGKPVAQALVNRDASVTVVHSKSTFSKELAQTADIIVSGMGKPRMITKDYLKKDVVIIDVGMSQDDAGQLSGDVASEEAKDIASFISLVRGGIAPLGPVMFFKQIIEMNR